MPEKSTSNLEFSPAQLLKKIKRTVNDHQEEFGQIFRNQIIPELNHHNIFIVDEEIINEEQHAFVKEYFQEQLLPNVQPMILERERVVTFLQNRYIYLAVKLSIKTDNELTEKKKKRYKYAVLEIPTSKHPRFITLPEKDGKKFIIFLDDIIRLFLDQIFPGYEIDSAYSIKLTRDAELYIDDEFSGNLLEKIQKSLSKRKTGVPSRFLYDETMPKDFLKFLRDALNLQKEDIIQGGKYHNFFDFFGFPNPGNEQLEYEKLPALTSGTIGDSRSIFESIKKEESLVLFPYHSYDHVIDFLDAAAMDDAVESIRITLYRTASDSKVIKALVEAAKNGKDVIVFVELKARFDEESNIDSASELEKAGVHVLYSFPGLKVHSKICLVKRIEDEKPHYYGYLSTGNFNEKTARVYTDLGLFTDDERLTKELKKVFRFLKRESKEESFNHLFVAPFNLRESIIEQVNNEIKNAKAGKKAEIMLKCNSIEDPKMIKKLYEASNAGVKINIIVRGICCLIPGMKGMSENINVISIVDRFLEHYRCYIFHNDGNEQFMVASADLMKRNLSRRVEVGFPIYSEKLKKKLKDLMLIQWNDNMKARIIDAKQANSYVDDRSLVKRRAQVETFEYLKDNE